MSDSRPVNLSPNGPPETVLPEEPAALRHAIEQAIRSDGDRLALLGEVTSHAPRSSAAWAAMGSRADSTIEAYAYFRVGYHRGLDSLRANGWRGSGYVRWEHPSNRGFLRSLAGLARCAAAIGESDEAERCEIFLRQCDPSWPPSDLEG
mgnify:CR=1 FL=1